MLSAKKRVSFLLFLLVFGYVFAEPAVQDSSLAAVPKKFPVSAFCAFSVNTMIAKAHEYVLKNGHILSELIWPLTPSLSYTLHCGLYVPKGIHIEGNVTFMQPLQTGNMVDTDFYNIDYSPPQFGITHFSEHSCNIIKGIRSTVKLGLQLPVPETAAMKKQGITLMLEPMLSLQYSKISWYSYNGYVQYEKQKHDGYYEQWSPHLSKNSFHGPAVSYKQQLIIPAVGAAFEASFPHKIRVSADFHISADVIADGEDIHYGRETRFIDSMDGGWAIHGGTRLTWECIPYCALFFHFLYEYSITQEGFTLIYEGLNSTVASQYYSRGASGTALHGCTFSAGIALMLGR